MKLGEMLEYTRSYIDDASVALIEGDNDQMWSDSILVNFMNQAERLLCRRAWTIIEYGKAPAGVIVLATNKVLYDLHPSILRVLDATPSTQTAPLGRTTDSQLRDPTPAGSDAFDVGEAAARESTALTGATLAFATDAGTRRLRVYPTPTATQNGVIVSMRVARLPISALTVDDVDAEPEVGYQWHEEICHYAAGKALTLPNVDGEFRTIGRTLLTEFNETVRLARQERIRAEMSGDRWAFSSSTAHAG